ncbi:MAG: hypothetical protein B7Y40_06515 [Gammaproteobacteria bacterium 28-57-27]|nr:MAG: hypothetical protein B7Y40_06515 [Gammaproteobacteria bacterium 28-57-27]
MRPVLLNRRQFLIASLAVCLSLPAAGTFAGELNPHADEILRAMSEHLANTKAFSVNADISNELITTEGQKLQFNSRATLLVERPSHFYITRQGRFADVALYFDGSKLSLFGKDMNAYMQKDVAGTMDDAIRSLEQGSGLSLPGADLLLANPYAALAPGVTSSAYYGMARIGGIECHHLAFRTPQVDWQLWVQAGKDPLPMKYVITTKWMTAAPQYSVQLSDWNTKPVISPAQFTFVPPADARKLDALTVDDMGEIVPAQGVK